MKLLCNFESICIMYIYIENAILLKIALDYTFMMKLLKIVDCRVLDKIYKPSDVSTFRLICIN